MILRPIENSDSVLMRRWLREPHVAEWFVHPDAWMEEIRLRETKYSFITHFIVEKDNRPVGFGQYYEYSKSGEDWNGTVPSVGTYSIDYLIGEAGYLGRGFGRETVILLTEKVFRDTEAQRVIVQPEKDNIRSRNTLLSAGYHYDERNDLFIRERAANR